MTNEQIFKIEPLSIYGETVAVICAIYGDALLEIATQEVSLDGGIAVKAIAEDALVAAHRQIAAMNEKIAEN